MNINSLLSISPVDGRYRSITAEISNYFSEFSLIKSRLEVEIAWLKLLAANQDIAELSQFTEQEIAWLDAILANFSLQEAELVKSYESKLNHDVKAVEVFLREKMLQHPTLKQAVEFIHFACTSEDISNVAYSMALHHFRADILLPKMHSIAAQLRSLAKEYADAAMPARTHGQIAVPTTMGKELANFVYRLERQIASLTKTAILAKFNGAVGNYNAHMFAYPNINWESLTKTFIESFGLKFNPYSTQIEPHDYIGDYFHCINQFNLILQDLNKDMWSYISLGYFKQKQVAGEVGSSTMPHKVNPIDFENSEGNLGLANAILAHIAAKLPISRLQRDLTDSTVLRNLGVGLAYSCIAYRSVMLGLNKIDLDKDKLLADLKANEVVLAEPVQTLLRKYGINNSYEQLRQFTRGKEITLSEFVSFVDNCASLPQVAKEQIKGLTITGYLGDAATLALKV